MIILPRRVGSTRPDPGFDPDACWAYAVVASVEAAYGIALNQAAPQLSVESLFAAMGLTDADKCTAGGSPTSAFEKLVTLDASNGLTGVNDLGTSYPVAAFERALFKGYFGLMLAVRRQPVVVHIEASAGTFFQYDGDPACYTGNLNHVVLVVGYFINRDDGSQRRISPPFWVIRNSWGVEWGDKGHMRMGIQGGDGVCGINVLPGIYPVVKNQIGIEPAMCGVQEVGIALAASISKTSGTMAAGWGQCREDPVGVDEEAGWEAVLSF
ncbi:unnamed protein product [Closterium sp. Naga37s-1]|nr:unnamed protein product [Closterium sp. Naga37s-1]